MPVLMVNPHPYPVKIGRGSVIGSFRPVDYVAGSDLVLPDTGSSSGSEGPLTSQAMTIKPKPDLVPEVEKLLLGNELTPAQTSEVRELLAQYVDVFSLPESRLGRTSKVQHRINTGTNPPIRQKARRIPAAQQPIYDREMG